MITFSYRNLALWHAEINEGLKLKHVRNNYANRKQLEWLATETGIKAALYKNLKPQQYDRKGKFMFRKTCLKGHGRSVNIVNYIMLHAFFFCLYAIVTI